MSTLLPSGTVYGVLLNVRQHVAAMTPSMSAAPYNAPPTAPVLYIKTPNTYCAHNGVVAVPTGFDSVCVSAAVAIVMARTATRVPVEQALEFVEGYAVAADVHLPHFDFYRPPIKQRNRDGFLPFGPRIVPRANVAAVDRLTAVTSVNGTARNTFELADMVRPVPQLLADITDFMTLFPGDIVLAVAAPNEITVRPGDRVTIKADDVGVLDFSVAAESASC